MCMSSSIFICALIFFSLFFAIKNNKSNLFSLTIYDEIGK